MSERTITTPFGPMLLVADESSLLRFSPGRGKNDTTPLLLEAERQLREYFSGQRKHFALPLAPVGTLFQRRVWDALCTIPYGETRSYGEIAAQIGAPSASRAVGAANHRNPLMIFIPCHRVIGANRKLTGYAGGLDMKAALLTLEADSTSN